MVYEHAVEVLANSFVQESCHNRAVHTAGKAQQHFIRAYFGPYLLYLPLYEILHGPVGLGLANLEHKVPQYLQTVLGIPHLRMELEGVDMAGLVCTGCIKAGCA